MSTTINMFRNSTEAVAFAAGETIFTEGDASNGLMYVVIEGEVEILVHGKPIDTIGPGASLGEVGLVDRGPRTATAVARAGSRLEPIDGKRFQFLVQQTPFFALQMMETLVQRLRQQRGA